MPFGAKEPVIEEVQMRLIEQAHGLVNLVEQVIGVEQVQAIGVSLGSLRQMTSTISSLLGGPGG